MTEVKTKIIESTANGYKETILGITDNVKFTFSEFCDTVSLEYIEESPDSWYSDSSKEVSITEVEAKDIIRMFLRQYPDVLTDL